MAKARKAFAKKKLLVEGDRVKGAVFIFANGAAQDEQDRVLTARLGDLSSSMLDTLAAHGLRQKIGDSYNLADTVGEAWRTANEVWARLKDDIWEAERVGGGFGINLADLAAAVSEYKGVEIGRDVIEGWPEDKRKEVAGHPKIKAIMARLKTERLEKEAEEAEDFEV